MTRLLTAAVLILVVLLGVFSGTWWGLLQVIALISTITYFEYAQILRVGVPARWVGAFAGLGLLVVPLDRTYLLLVLSGLLLFALPLRATHLQAAFGEAAATFLGMVYVYGGFKAAYLLGLHSPWWLLFSLAISWTGDSGAYYVGRMWGWHKLAPRISPGKSWEGALASILCSTLFFAVAARYYLALSLPIAALLALVGNIAGQVGDLAESGLKRAVGVKDSGTLLPGHGGMLDRVDSVLFTLPVIYSLTIAFRL